MKKIPALFMRNHHGDNLVRNEVTPGCEWVIAGEGRATVKWDGTACLVHNGVLFKRYDAKGGKTPPAGFQPAQPEAKSGHWPGWVPVNVHAKADKYHVEAMEWYIIEHGKIPEDGTYELCGPKVNGNHEKFDEHFLIKHGVHSLTQDPRTFAEIRNFLADHDLEGIVWHHSDSRLCKIKARDFGLPWPRFVPPPES